MINLRSLVIKSACQQRTVCRSLKRQCHSERRDQPHSPQIQLDKKELARQCQQLCMDNNLKLVFCSDAGSRAWGYHYDDSDYDLKGFYVSNNETYLQSIIDNRRKIDTCTHANGKVDIELWDIGKVLSQYFRKANQTPLFWMQSPVVYYQTPAGERLQRFLFTKNERVHNVIIQHYFGLANSSFRLFEREKELKRYVNVWRGIISALWAIVHRKIAPPTMDALLADKQVTEMIPLEHVRNILRLRIEGVTHFECDEASIQLIVDKLEFLEKYNDRQDAKFGFDSEWKSIVEELLLRQPPELFSKI